MSIATDEAKKYFPTQYWPHMEPNGDYRGKECYLEGVKSSDIQDVYIQGRTVLPIEAEIEAAAEVIAVEVGDLSLSEELAKDALYAARKAVTE